MHVTSAPPPALAAETVQRLLKRDYGVDGTLSALVSERDQNFRVDTRDGRRFVAKIANAREAAEVTDFQVEALRRLERCGCPVTIPRVVPAIDGASVTTVAWEGERLHLRLVTWVPGKPLVGLSPDAGLARELGEALAHIDAGLRGFAHPGDRQELLWDMQRALEVREQVAHVPDAALRKRVARCFDDFESQALPAFPSLRSQVIHNDLNPANVLVTDETRPRVAGVIDFGDMVRAPLVIDVAIAASYLRSAEEGGLLPAAALVAGFHSVTPLRDDELSLVHGLIRTRLATTIVMMYARLSRRDGDDDWLHAALRTEDSAERFLAQLERLGAERLGAMIWQAIRLG